MKTINKVKEFEYVGNNSCGVEGYKTYSEFFFDKKENQLWEVMSPILYDIPGHNEEEKDFEVYFITSDTNFSREEDISQEARTFLEILSKKKVDFEIDLRMDSWKTSELIKEFLKQIRPFGACREGEFSSVETDIPFTDEVTSSDDGWSYKQYDYSVKKVRFLSYESCTDSKITISNISNHRVLMGKNVGPNTLSRVFSALRNIKSDSLNELINLLKKN